MRIPSFACGAALLLACHPPSTREKPQASGDLYAREAMWVCRPDLPGDACHGDLSATEIHADGTRAVVPHLAAKDPPVDCFYVYPTVDMHLRPGNHVDFGDTDEVRRTARAQIARFSEVCAVYAPLYRQVSIGTYVFGNDEDKQRYFGVAFSDIDAAFEYYLRHFNAGRRIVLVGHSQGAQMIAMLVKKIFDRDPALRAKLVVAMPIGFYFDVPEGATVGGTFASVPTCTTDEQTSCVVAYRTIAAGDRPDPKYWPLPAGRRAMCVDPASIGGEKMRSAAIFPNDRLHVEGVTTPFVMLRDFYRGRCVKDDGGRDYLEIAEVPVANDQRMHLVELSKHHGFIGLHLFDMQFTSGDMVELVKKKLSSPTEPPPQPKP